jgi:hypothetical protein
MAGEEVFQAAKKVYGLYGAFFKAVAEEIGMDSALALHVQAHEDQGVASGRMLKEKMGEGEIDIEKLGSVLRESNLSIGIESELAHASAMSALFRNSRCPMYDGYRLGGLDDQTAEALCQKGATAKLGTMLKLLDPQIVCRLTRYRANPDEPCEEEILRG